MKRKPRGPVLSMGKADDLRYSRVPFPQVRAILVIRTGGLGDFILILPCIEVLRRRWPESPIEILGHASIAAIAVNSFQASRVTSIDRSLFARLFQSTARLDPQVSEYLSHFDLVVSFLPDQDGSIRRNLARAVPNVLVIPPPQPGSHASMQFLRNLPFANAEDSVLRPTVYVEHADRDRGEAILRAAGVGGPPRVVIHPGSGSERKNWPAECFGNVARRLSEAGTQVVFLEGEADTRQVAGTLRAFRGRAPVISGLTVKEAAGLLSNCQLLIGNDSGISHLAAAVGVPLIALFGPSDPEVWRPLGSNVEVMRFSDADPERVAKRALDLLSPPNH